ncbi:SIR2 family protein [candidate division KSB1 bacterium]|nr:MAG: SIR2 family protein [candidate division KSB1 bacterium]
MNDVTRSTIVPEGSKEPVDESTAGILKFLAPSQTEWREILPNTSSISNEEERKKIEDKAKESKDVLDDMLLSSLQMPNLVVLAGSGTSLGDVGGPSMGDLWKYAIDDKTGTPRANAKKIMKKVKFDIEREGNNIEALLSQCEAYLQINEDSNVRDFVEHCKKVTLEKCGEFLKDKNTGAWLDEKLKAHCTFLHRLSRRRVRDPRLKVFTTNYDLCFERAAGLQSLIITDGFSYTKPRIFDPRYFGYDIVRRPKVTAEHGDYLEGVFHLLKLHGSVNWARTSDDRIEEKDRPTPAEACLIYPAKGKYQQSYIQPHLELISQYLASLREPNTCFIVVGFGFNDDHLSEPILAAVTTNPRLRLIVADFMAEDAIKSEVNNYWRDLCSLANNGEDIWFINASFKDFAYLIPDLRTLTPAQQLEKAIRNVRGSQ